MNCELAEQLISKKLDNEITADDECLLQAHIDICPSCYENYQLMMKIHEITVSSMDEVAVPSDLHDSIMTAIAKEGLYHEENIFTKLLASFKTGRLKVASIAMVAVLVISFASLYGDNSDVPVIPSANVATGQLSDAGNAAEKGDLLTPKVKNNDSADKIMNNSKKNADNNSNKNKGNTNVVKPSHGKGDNITTNKPVKPVTNENVIALPEASSGLNVVGSVSISTVMMTPDVNYTSPVFDSKTGVVYFVKDKGNNSEVIGVDPNSSDGGKVVTENIVSYDNLLNGLASPDSLPAWVHGLEQSEKFKVTSWAWSYDNEIAFSISRPNGNTAVYLASKDGSSIVEVSNKGGGDELIWSADDKKLAFTDSNGLLYIAKIGDSITIEKCTSSMKLGDIKDLVWHLNSTKLLFSGYDSVNNSRGIYMAEIE